MLTRIVSASLLLLLAGCGQLSIERGYDASARKVIAEETKRLVEQLRTTEVTPEATTEVLDEIDALQDSQIIRAKIAQTDFGNVPEKPVVLGSEDDNVHQITYAGCAATQETIRELPEKAVDAIVNTGVRIAKKVVPWYIRWGFVGLVVLFILCCAVTIVLVFSRKFWKRATGEAIERFGRLPKEQRKDLTASAHTLGQAFDRMEGK